MSKKEEAEILVPMSVEAVPVDQADSTLPPFGKVGESPVPLNHNRFYCNKCHTVSCVHRMHGGLFEVRKSMSTQIHQMLSRVPLFPISLVPLIPVSKRFKTHPPLVCIMIAPNDSPTTYHSKRLRGVVPIAIPSTLLRPDNVKIASSCNLKIGYWQAL